MKKLALIYKEKEYGEVIVYLKASLLEIFQGYIEVEAYSEDEFAKKN